MPDPYAHHEDAVKGDLIPSQDALDRDCAAWARPLHLHMLSAQPTSESDQPQGEYFGASIRLATAMHPQQQCIIATHHNGSVLTQSHGFPLRVVVPGHVGARWVKWLRGLHVSTQYEQSPPMRLDYKILTPPRDASKGEQKEWKEKLMGPDKDVAFRKDELADKKAMQTLGVGSAIETPADGDSFADRGDKEGAVVTARGYATGQDGEHSEEAVPFAATARQRRVVSPLAYLAHPYVCLPPPCRLARDASRAGAAGARVA